MRKRIVGIVAAAALLQFLLGAPSHASQHASTKLPATGDINLPYPGEIDLEQEPSGWTYRLNENERALYMSTADPPGKSVCYGACAKKWIPVIAQGDAKPLGDWSLVVRQDGRHQWAFKGHPIYIYANDTSDKVTGVAGTFHVMPHFH